MNRDRKVLFPLKSFFLAAIVSLLSLAILLPAVSRALMLIDHFERFYEWMCFLIWGAEAVLLGSFARKTKGNPFLFIGAVILTVMFFIILVGLIVGKGQISLSRLGLHAAVYALISLLLQFLPKKKQKRSTNPYQR